MSELAIGGVVSMDEYKDWIIFQSSCDYVIPKPMSERLLGYARLMLKLEDARLDSELEGVVD